VGSTEVEKSQLCMTEKLTLTCKALSTLCLLLTNGLRREICWKDAITMGVVLPTGQGDSKPELGTAVASPLVGL